MQAKLLNAYVPPAASPPVEAPSTARAVAVTVDPASENTEKTPNFHSELDLLLKSDDQAVRTTAMRKQLNRSIRRSTGTSADGSVDEEALFAGMVGLKILVESGREAYVQYADQVRATMAGAAPGASVETAAKAALEDAAARKSISSDSVGAIYSESFAASQLDDNTDALYDSIGGRRDKTVAVASFQSALDLGVESVLQIQLGELDAPLRNINEIPFKQKR